MSRKRYVPLLENMPKNRLPTEIQALGHYLWLQKQKPNCSKKESALQTVRDVNEMWNMSYIQTVDDYNAFRLFFSNKTSVYQR